MYQLTDEDLFHCSSSQLTCSMNSSWDVKYNFEAKTTLSKTKLAPNVAESTSFYFWMLSRGQTFDLTPSSFLWCRKSHSSNGRWQSEHIIALLNLLCSLCFPVMTALYWLEESSTFRKSHAVETLITMWCSVLSNCHRDGKQVFHCSFWFNYSSICPKMPLVWSSYILLLCYCL